MFLQLISDGTENKTQVWMSSEPASVAITLLETLCGHNNDRDRVTDRITNEFQFSPLDEGEDRLLTSWAIGSIWSSFKGIPM